MASSGSGQDSAYERELARAKATDLSTVERSKAVVIVKNEDGSFAEDGDGNKVVMLTPSLIPIDMDSNGWENGFLLFLRETEEIAKNLYRIIYVHSGFSPPLWFTWWLIGLRGRVSRDHRKNIAGLSIIHPSLTVRVAVLAMRAVLSGNFWKKVHYAERVEEMWLDGILSEADTNRNIGQSVVMYEGLLVEEAEELRESARRMGVPLVSRDAGEDEMDG